VDCQSGESVVGRRKGSIYTDTLPRRSLSLVFAIDHTNFGGVVYLWFLRSIIRIHPFRPAICSRERSLNIPVLSEE